MSTASGNKTNDLVKLDLTDTDYPSEDETSHTALSPEVVETPYSDSEQDEGEKDDEDMCSYEAYLFRWADETKELMTAYVTNPSEKTKGDYVDWVRACVLWPVIKPDDLDEFLYDAQGFLEATCTKKEDLAHLFNQLDALQEQEQSVGEQLPVEDEASQPTVALLRDSQIENLPRGMTEEQDPDYVWIDIPDDNEDAEEKGGEVPSVTG
ncbi:hypothetical protein TREMEDRAFT_58254 [Tremella mesenterica DSM 1558]|uniref:uncharacterized protein n=1 Tax=Tremella mesenterica (strain ATCC 24925 / CBS 8224 / DSM 1558 / NBRC 9311 / NRRL Y-6157 / RJB 2259-6 / UBC 559-6) TaxID=578456 RepID=UPI0003F491C8|nr:uncharacterized protein TREMEDRAFT_58254 [Tremella mesenterica DSM 1558]EIW72101.1 hypothetical protein TREMEDRAFT_58254 [Tremella mesenterica DSM 1558]